MIIYKLLQEGFFKKALKASLLAGAAYGLYKSYKHGENILTSTSKQVSDPSILSLKNNKLHTLSVGLKDYLRQGHNYIGTKFLNMSKINTRQITTNEILSKIKKNYQYDDKLTFV